MSLHIFSLQSAPLEQEIPREQYLKQLREDLGAAGTLESISEEQLEQVGKADKRSLAHISDRAMLLSGYLSWQMYESPDTSLVPAIHIRMAAEGHASNDMLCVFACGVIGG